VDLPLTPLGTEIVRVSELCLAWFDPRILHWLFPTSTSRTAWNK